MNDVVTRPFPLNALLEPRHPWRAILVGWAAAAIPAFLLLLLVTALFPQAKGPAFSGGGHYLAFRLVVEAPLRETLVMAVVLELLLLVIPPRWAVAVSSLGWGIVHSLDIAVWGLIIWWPFLIFSTLYVTWRGRSRLLAFGIVFAVHALNNLVPALLLLRSA